MWPNRFFGGGMVPILKTNRLNCKQKRHSYLQPHKVLMVFAMLSLSNAFRAMRYLSVTCLLFGAATCDSWRDASIETADHHVSALIDWLISRGGTLNDKLEIRRVNRNDKDSEFGVFAKESIKMKELLLDIPAKCLISAGPPEVGDRVQVNYKKSGKWIGGVVVSIESEPGNEKYNVMYDDGYKQSKVSSQNLHKYSDEGIVCDTIHSLIHEIKLGENSEFAPYVTFAYSCCW